MNGRGRTSARIRSHLHANQRPRDTPGPRANNSTSPPDLHRRDHPPELSTLKNEVTGMHVAVKQIAKQNITLSFRKPHKPKRKSAIPPSLNPPFTALGLGLKTPAAAGFREGSVFPFSGPLLARLRCLGTIYPRGPLTRGLAHDVGAPALSPAGQVPPPTLPGSAPRRAPSRWPGTRFSTCPSAR